MTTEERNQVRDCLRNLARYGRERYHDPDGVHYGAALGAALSPYLRGIDALYLAAELLEDQNHHDAAARVRAIINH